ncbi:MAG: formimidoylglutamase [Bacteroidia bacterium]|nr:formimidoylglutamase [Bacteroidia bacterium]
MKNLISVSKVDLQSLTAVRVGETKLGECLDTVPQDESVESYLAKSVSKFVLLGVPEDVGVKANFGRPGAATAWENTLKNFVNIQSNQLLHGNEILVLGYVDTHKQMQQAQPLNPAIPSELNKLRDLVSEIDEMLVPIVKQIVANGKIPIIIGGGHNNAYCNIKGTAQAKGKGINAINFDAHTDFRALEGRHSGNGFSYAYSQGFLNKYFVFGIHECYTSEAIFKEMNDKQSCIHFNTFEQMAIRHEKDFEEELLMATDFINSTSFGIELDLDSLAFVPSSAMTASGFHIEQMRRFLHVLASSRNVSYLHICEAAPSLGDDKNPNIIGKLISYLVADFVKANVRSM